MQSSTEASQKKRLRLLNRSLFELGTQLFETDTEAERYLADVTQETSGSSKQVRALRTEVNAVMGQKKDALRRQEQISQELAEGITKLIELNTQQEALFDSLYTFVLSRMLWLRNREPIKLSPSDGELLTSAFGGVMGVLQRSATFVLSQTEMIKSHVSTSILPWIVAFIVFGLVPWVAAKLRRVLKRRARDALSDEEKTPGNRVLIVLPLGTAIWPAYLVLVTWRQAQFIPIDDGVLGSALIGGLRIAALMLWVLLLARAVFRQGGYGERVWGLHPRLATCCFRRSGSGVSRLSCCACLVTSFYRLQRLGRRLKAVWRRRGWR